MNPDAQWNSILSHPIKNARQPHNSYLANYPYTIWEILRITKTEK
jgi:hypothetical protein